MQEKQGTEQSKIAEFISDWRGSPLRFVRECIGAKPTKQQQIVLKTLEQWGVRVAVKSCHGSGKSTLIAWIILWAISCFSDVKVAVTAPTAHQLMDVVKSEVEKWVRTMPELWQSQIIITADKFQFKGMPGFAVLRTGRKENPEALQGFHAENMLFLIDEASGIDDRVFEVAQGSLTSKNSTILMFANPTRNSGYFYNAFHKNRDLWMRFTFSALDSPNVEQGFIDAVRDEYGEDSDMYRVRVLGEFPNASEMQFIPTTLVEAAMGRHIEAREYDFAPVILGVDVALFGGDRSTIYLRQGLYSHRLYRQQGNTPKQLASAVAKFEDEYKADAVIVDATGVGESVIALLREMNRHPIAFYAGGGSSHDNCLNARVSAWWDMREWLSQGGCIDDDVELRDDLSAPEFDYNLKGKLVLEKKEDMKKRGLASPDNADGLAVTFGARVHKRETAEMRSAIISDDDYNVMAW